MSQILTYSSFAIVSLVVMVVFLTVTSYSQLTVAILLYPLLVYLGFKIFPRKNGKYLSKKAITAIPPLKLAEKVEAAKEENQEGGVADIDKRAFLKLLGGIGFSIFLFSIFNKKIMSLLSSSFPQANNTALIDPVPVGKDIESTQSQLIDPPQNKPMDEYSISEIDDSVITYVGFIKKDGAWFIMREDTDTGSFRYAKGDSNFPGNWSNRKNLKYDYLNNVF